MTTAHDTIAAIATAPGRGAVGILRLSGPATRPIAQALLGGQRLPRPRRAVLRAFLDSTGQLLDEGLVLFFPAPHSYTGEDVVELQGHGGPVVLDQLLSAALALGARLARPGEFSERAFLNGRMDLAQAEAVADLIDAASTAAARGALRSLQGEFSQQVHGLVAKLTALRIYVEAAIDFPDEELDLLANGQVSAQLADLLLQLDTLRGATHQGTLLRDGMTVVITGQPNVGKSSLLNRLARRESAIVTPIPGTTRDVLRETIALDGLPLHLVDTAGLRNSVDPVEQEGIRRAWVEVARADRILLIVDDRDLPQTGIALTTSYDLPLQDQAIYQRFPSDCPLTLVRNKADLTSRPVGLSQGALGPEVTLSAENGEGLNALVEHLKDGIGYTGGGEGNFTARRRHLEALTAATYHLREANAVLVQQSGSELLAEELRLAQDRLGEITGKITADDLLGKIFGEFCIGK